MPQMAPIKWLSLFIIFSLSFIMFSSMVFYSYMPTNYSSKKFMKLTNSMNWKW